MRSSARLLSVARFAAAALVASPLAAQFAQYTAPGQSIYEPETRQQKLDAAIERALWHVGAVAIDPYLGLSDLGYLETRSSEGETSQSDWTVSASAGLRAFVPVGGRSTLVGFALPEYVWFEKNEDARRLNQRLGLGLFTYFNRFALELRAERREDLGYVTSETLDRVASRGDSFGAEVEIPLGIRISLVGGAGWSSAEVGIDEEVELPADYENLDNDSTSWNAGLRLYLTSTLALTGTYGESEADFADGVRDRSNSGESYGAGLSWRRAKTGASISVNRSKLEPEPGSEFAGYDGETWNGEVSWSPRERVSIGFYGRRNLAYTLDAEESFFVDERTGARLSLGIGWRLSLTLFAEQGTLDYGEGIGVTSDREDDLTAWGAEIAFPLGQRFNVRTGFRRTEVDSELPGAGYRLDQIVGSLGFGLGGGGTWF